MLNVPHGMGYPARMPVVPNRNEFFALQKTRSQKCTREVHFLTVLHYGQIHNPLFSRFSHIFRSFAVFFTADALSVFAVYVTEITCI